MSSKTLLHFLVVVVVVVQLFMRVFKHKCHHNSSIVDVKLLADYRPHVIMVTAVVYNL